MTLVLSSSTLCREDEHDRCDATYAGTYRCGCQCHDLPDDLKGDLRVEAHLEAWAEEEANRLDEEPETLDGGFDD